MTEDYLAELSSRLHVREHDRARIVEEVRDHLDDAVARRNQAGEDHVVAVERALADFGSAATLANEFNVSAGTRAMRRAPAVALLAGAAVCGGFLLAAATQPQSGATRAPMLAETSFFVAALACQVAFVAGFCGASRAAAQWRSPGVPAADRQFVRRCSAVSITALGVSAAGWATTLLLVLGRLTQPNRLTLTVGTTLMCAGVVVSATLLTRLQVNPTDDALDGGAGLGLLGLGERCSSLVRRHPVVSCLSVAVGSAIPAMTHAESTIARALPWGAAQAAAVVIGFVLLGPTLGVRRSRIDVSVSREA